jgi:hypothetical protein
MASNAVQGRYHRMAYGSARGRLFSGTLKRAAFLFGLIVAIAVVLLLVVASPLVLRQLGSLKGENWTQLSDIGQTYGAASALLTGLALIGVAGSMVFEVRANKVSLKQAWRERHARLVEMALNDPVYQRCWGDDPVVYGSADRIRQQAYINLIVSAWEDDYILGDFQEHALRKCLVPFFQGEAGREFWAKSRNIRLELAENRRDRRFCYIIEEEYQKAIAMGPPTVQAKVSPLPLSVDHKLMWHNSAIKAGGALLLGAMGGIAFGAFLRQRKH